MSLCCDEHYNRNIFGDSQELKKDEKEANLSITYLSFNKRKLNNIKVIFKSVKEEMRV